MYMGVACLFYNGTRAYRYMFISLPARMQANSNMEIPIKEANTQFKGGTKIIKI